MFENLGHEIGIWRAIARQIPISCEGLEEGRYG
jgi:hypothetical protein